MKSKKNPNLKIGQATIDDVARSAGVSTATVSRVLNSAGMVAEQTSRRVLKAVRELGYVPQTAARNLASHRTNTIGLLLPSIGEDFFGQMLRGVEAGVAESGYDLLIATQPETSSQKRTPAAGQAQH